MALGARCILSFGRVSSQICPTIRANCSNSIVLSSRKLFMAASITLSKNVLCTSVQTSSFYRSSAVLECISTINPLAVQNCGAASSEVGEDLTGDDEGDTWSLY